MQKCIIVEPNHLVLEGKMQKCIILGQDHRIYLNKEKIVALLHQFPIFKGLISKKDAFLHFCTELAHETDKVNGYAVLSGRVQKSRPSRGGFKPSIVHAYSDTTAKQSTARQ